MRQLDAIWRMRRPSVQVMLAQVHRHGKSARVIREVNVTPAKR